MPSLFAGASFPLASRLTTFDLISNRFKLASVVCSVRVGDNLIDATVYAKHFTGSFRVFLGKLEPNDNTLFTEGASLNKLCFAITISRACLSA
jgi:hypothetical protein